MDTTAVIAPVVSPAEALPSPGPQDQQIPFFYGIPVWGEEYVEKLCSVGIPSLLAPGNIPALPNKGVSSFVIVTTPEDAARIRAKPIFALLERHISVEFLYLPSKGKLPTSKDHGEKYVLLMIGHSMVADKAMGRGCAVFLGPDAIYVDGMMKSLHGHIVAGKEAVIGMGPRVAEETIVPDLVELGLLKDGEPLVVRPRQGVKLLLRHLHHDIRVHRWTSPFFPRNPYMCGWDMPDGMLVRAFGLHPYIVDYRDLPGWTPRVSDCSPVDGTFIRDCAITWDKIYQVTDSDEFFVLSLTSMHSRDYGHEPNTDPISTIAQWLTRGDMTPVHHRSFVTAIKLHAEDLNDSWRQLERETLIIAYQVLEIAKTMPKLDMTPKNAIDQVNRTLTDPRGIPEGMTDKLALRAVKLALRVAWRKIKRALLMRRASTDS
jgi:hypothetical protein